MYFGFNIITAVCQARAGNKVVTRRGELKGVLCDR